MKKISNIPVKIRALKYKVEYLKAIADAMDDPWQSEDKRSEGKVLTKLATICSEYTKVPYWNFTNCCTDSLNLAIRLFTPKNCSILIPTYTWKAIPNAVIWAERKPIYVDIDKTGCICIKSLHNILKNCNEEIGALIYVHSFGTCNDISKHSEILKQYNSNAILIEDCAQSFWMGEPYKFPPGQLGDISCYSFDFTKSPGTLGSGGAIATNNKNKFNKIKQSLAHTLSSEIPGTKSCLDITSAAVLLKDIEIMERDKHRNKRSQVANLYNKKLPYPRVPGENYIAYKHIISATVNGRKALLEELNRVGILAKPVSDQFANLPNAHSFCEKSIEMPINGYIDLNELEEALNKCIFT